MPTTELADGAEGSKEPRPRWLFWAIRQHGDRQLAEAEGRIESVTWRIPGHGSGYYQRIVDVPIVGLVRYERHGCRRPGARFPYGSRLVTHTSCDWVPDAHADSCVMRGSDDPGEPITGADAAAIVERLGFQLAKLDEPRP